MKNVLGRMRWTALVLLITGTAHAAPGIDLRGLTRSPVCLVVRSPDGTLRQSDPKVCAERLRPASTFKIPNALIGADLGLIDGPDAVLPYDRERYPPENWWPEGWAQDQPLRRALEISALPLFRGLALRIGATRMQGYLDRFAYGNRSTTGGLDLFWLKGGLAISAVEQVDFLSRLLAGTLPVSPRAHQIVREAIPLNGSLHWKTGTTSLPTRGWLNWLVGWVDGRDGAYVFACWLKDPSRDVNASRAERARVCRGALARLGLMPE